MGSPEGERNYDVFDGIDASVLLRSHSPIDPPPSYDTSTDATYTDEKNKTAMALEDSPAQLLYPTAGPSIDPPRRSLPTSPPQTSPPPSPLNQQTEFSREPSRQQEQLNDSRIRPQLPHAPQSAPDPRARARLEHVKELEEVDPFGNRFHHESPFEAGRRAQRVGDDIPSNAHPRGHVLPNGRMPSVKPGEIMPGNTMRPPNGVPAFFPPSAAPPFPPTIHHAPIRPAHFPPEMHPPSPKELVREPSYQQGPPHHPHAMRSYSHQHPPPPPLPQPIRSQSYQYAPPQLARNHSYGPSPPPPQPSRPPHDSQPSALPAPRRYTYDARGVPPGLTPNGRYGSPPPGGLPPMPTPSVPHGYSHSQPYPQPHPSDPPPRGMPQPQPPPGRSILRAPQRSSLPPPRPTVSIPAPAPAPVRLPSHNVPPLNGVVHTPPAPSGSPRPDPMRAPRSTPKPVMPQLLAPLIAQDSNHRAQLQRSASVAPLPSEKGGLLSKTRSILRKRNSSSGIKTHADGAISFATQPGGSAKRYENHVPALPPLREENAGVGGKLGKRLSKKK